MSVPKSERRPSQFKYLVLLQETELFFIGELNIKNNKCIIRLNKNNIYKHLRKIKKLFKLVNLNKLKIIDVELSHKSWYGQVKKGYRNKKSIYNIDKKIRSEINERNNTNLSSY